jgi:hypothetical protein
MSQKLEGLFGGIVAAGMALPGFAADKTDAPAEPAAKEAKAPASQDMSPWRIGRDGKAMVYNPDARIIRVLKEASEAAQNSAAPRTPGNE